VENLSRGNPKIQSNDPTFHATYTPTYPNIFGRFIRWTWYSDNRGKEKFSAPKIQAETTQNNARQAAHSGLLLSESLTVSEISDGSANL
jgi:hypothetical protein